MSLESLKIKGLDATLNAVVEGMELATYAFDEHLTKKSESTLKTINLDTKEKAAGVKKLQKVIDETLLVTESIAIARDFVNSPPNVLNSETYAKAVKKDVSKLMVFQ